VAKTLPESIHGRWYHGVPEDKRAWDGTSSITQTPPGSVVQCQAIDMVHRIFSLL
jgi:hypothetical protein